MLNNFAIFIFLLTYVATAHTWNICHNQRPPMYLVTTCSLIFPYLDQVNDESED